MPAVGPDGMRTPDYQNPAAIRYARYMLQKLVSRGLIDSVASAVSHYGGDPTAAWRALSVLTGAPKTYPGMTGTGEPTPRTTMESVSTNLPAVQQLLALRNAVQKLSPNFIEAARPPVGTPVPMMEGAVAEAVRRVGRGFSPYKTNLFPTYPITRRYPISSITRKAWPMASSNPWQ